MSIKEDGRAKNKAKAKDGKGRGKRPNKDDASSSSSDDDDSEESPKRKTGTKSLRKSSEATKKQVAARQKWTCHSCHDLLSSAYQIDHTQALADGGVDDPCNMTALCPCCHAIKSQNEALVRAEIARQQREDCRRLYEEAIRREEEDNRREVTRPSGVVKCLDCKEMHYRVFSHDCKKVEERVDTRLGRKTCPPVEKELGNLFLNFTFEGGGI
jgi:hypothetical protein